MIAKAASRLQQFFGRDRKKNEEPPRHTRTADSTTRTMRALCDVGESIVSNVHVIESPTRLYLCVSMEVKPDALAAQMEDVFFIVVMTQLKRAADARMKAAQRLRVIRCILAQPQSREALAGKGRARSLLERMTALLGARNLAEPVFALLSVRRMLRRGRT